MTKGSSLRHSGLSASYSLLIPLKSQLSLLLQRWLAAFHHWGFLTIKAHAKEIILDRLVYDLSTPISSSFVEPCQRLRDRYWTNIQRRSYPHLHVDWYATTNSVWVSRYISRRRSGPWSQMRSVLLSLYITFYIYGLTVISSTSNILFSLQRFGNPCSESQRHR